MRLTFKNRIALHYVLATAALVAAVYLVVFGVVQHRVYRDLDTSLRYEAAKHLKEISIAGADIHFDRVEFAYGDKSVVQGIDLHIQPGQLVALVGQSGSGKTTLANLLLRFYDPQQGAVRIDGVFKGEIRSDDTLVIGEGADVEAQIDVATVIVRGGTLRGDVRARRSIELHVPARVEGSLHAPQVMLEKGVQFEGSCRMAPMDDPAQGGLT